MILSVVLWVWGGSVSNKYTCFEYRSSRLDTWYCSLPSNPASPPRITLEQNLNLTKCGSKTETKRSPQLYNSVFVGQCQMLHVHQHIYAGLRVTPFLHLPWLDCMYWINSCHSLLCDEQNNELQIPMYIYFTATQTTQKSTHPIECWNLYNPSFLYVNFHNFQGKALFPHSLSIDGC